MRFAAIDFGGSFIKSAVVDSESASLHHVHRTPFPPFVSGLPPSHREVDLARITADAHAHLDRLLSKEPSCAGVLASTQMHGFALVDRSGHAVSNFISWQDQRSLPHFEELTACYSPAIRLATGRDIGAGHAAAVLHSMVASYALPDGARTPVPLPNAVFGASSEFEPTADETLAAAFGVYDVEHSSWHTELLAALGLDRLHWPRVTRWNEAIGELAHGSRRLPIYSPIGDQQAALTGALLRADELSVNIGTGSQVSVLTDVFRSGITRSGITKVRPYFDGLFLQTVTHIPAGRALNGLARLLARDRAVEEVWKEVDRALESLAETDLVVDLSFYPGAFGQRGRIENIHESNLTVGHLFLAAFGNMASNYAAAAELLRPERDWGTIAFSGGLAHRSRRLREMVAEKLARPYRLSPSPEETLMGLACLGRVIAGFEPSVAEASDAIRRVRGDEVK
jgi:sugar (pentulose or hexulose) kinase